jgi:hypothetical protein
MRHELEAETDRLAFAPWAHLGADAAARLGEIGGVAVRTLVANGGLPAALSRARADR